MQELWRPIKGYEGLYDVSDQGRVRRNAVPIWHPAYGGYGYIRRERILRQRTDSVGYLVVGPCRDGKRKLKRVHRLVAEAFVPGDHSLTVNHIDGNKLNNVRSNLEWVSRADNLRHAHKNGLMNYVRGSGTSKEALRQRRRRAEARRRRAEQAGHIEGTAIELNEPS